MTEYCDECGHEVMPTDTRIGSFKCPKHGWVDGDPVEWTPERMQARIDELKRTMQFRP